MTDVDFPVSDHEFGIWYEEQIANVDGRYVCTAGADLDAERNIRVSDAVGVMNAVLARHPEAFTRYNVDDEGVLRKQFDPRVVLEPQVVRYPSGWDPDDIAVHLFGLPLSLETGVLVRFGVQADDLGRTTRLFVLAHHIIWDVRSEEIFWTEVDHSLDLMQETSKDPPRTEIRSAGDPAAPQSMVVLPDLQDNLTVPNGRKVWGALSAVASEEGVTRFAWVVGHLGLAVAEWSESGSVLAYIDLDGRPLTDDNMVFGFCQAQLEIGSISSSTSGRWAAKWVHANVMRQLIRALTDDVTPVSEAADRLGQACKFYVRKTRYQPPLRHVRPIDLRVPAARNQLSVGLTATEDGLNVTVTARRDLFTDAQIADLTQRAGRALIVASHQRNF